MNSLAGFLVRTRYILLIIFLLIGGACIFLSKKVDVNSDMTKYLPDSSSMKQGTDKLAEEFPDMKDQSRLRIMVDDLSEADRQTVLSGLRSIPNVEVVDYLPDSEFFQKDNHTLFVVKTSFEYDSEEFREIRKTAEDTVLAPYKAVMETDESKMGALPTPIVAGVVAILMIILIIMCDSWLEPFLFLLSIGLSILINMGTNAFLPNVSETTHSIAAILQLVLAMDYSIILSNRYRQARKNLAKEMGGASAADAAEIWAAAGNRETAALAMKKAIASSIPSVCSSSLTTVVGLLSLCFMQFKIGADLGIVLAKGVFLSMLCVFTVLPGLLVLFDNLIRKTAKKSLTIPTGGLAKIEYKIRILMAVLFVLIFAGVFIAKGSAKITYMNLEPEDQISKVFPRGEQILLLYNNADEGKIPEMLEAVGQEKAVTSINTYANTLGAAMNASDMYAYISGMMGSFSGSLPGDFQLDESLVRFLYYDRFSERTGETLSLEDFIGYVNNVILENPVFASQLDEESAAAIREAAELCSKEALTAGRSAEEISEMFGVSKTVIKLLMKYLGYDSMSIVELLDALDRKDVSLALSLSGGLSDEEEKALSFYGELVSSIMQEKVYTSSDMAAVLSRFSAGTGGQETAEADLSTQKYTDLVYELFFADAKYNTEWRMTLDEVFDHILTSETFSDFLDEDTKKLLQLAKFGLFSGKEQMVGREHSLFVISAVFADGESEAIRFVEKLDAQSQNLLSGDYYLIGNSPMAYEMSGSFGKELNKITLITAIAIFLVVLITFRNILVPLVLVLLIQCSVYVTMCVMKVMGAGMHYLALLIVQSLLMGATIDYAIVFTNFYIEKRRDRNRKDAMKSTYQASIRTILTSGLIMVIVTWVMGYVFTDPSVGQICHIISIGVVSALFMILLFLPAVLSVCDRLVVPSKQRFVEK